MKNSNIHKIRVFVTKTVLLLLSLLIILSTAAFGSLHVLAADEEQSDNEHQPADYISEKENLSEAEKKISTQLLQLTGRYESPHETTESGLVYQIMELDQAQFNSQDNSDDEVYVYIRFDSGTDTEMFLPYVSRLVNEDRGYGLAAAWVQKDNIISLAELREVRNIRKVMPPIIHTGYYNSEGDGMLKSDIARTQLGADGTGVKIGIISDGVDNLSSSVSSGDLPPNVTVLSNTRGGDEGTAMLEIVYDLAPNAQLYFHDCGETVLDFNNAIDALVASGCNIICDDIGWILEPFFEYGIVAQHISQVINNYGIIYVSSAGNDATEHFQGQFYNDGKGFSDFSYGTNPDVKGILMSIEPGEHIDIVMQWDDPFGGSSNDYDLCMFDIVSGDCIAISDYTQDGNDDPLEVISVQNISGSYIFAEIKAHAYKASQDKTLEIFCFRGDFSDGNTNLVSADSIYGHPAVPEVLAVGAVHYDDGLIAEYSSRGPVTMRNKVIQKPDICGIAGVQISGSGGFGYWTDGHTRFFGTSASAPHIAAVAAQIKSRFPWLSNNQVKQILKDTCVDMGSSGFDTTYGNGLADTYAACLTYLYAEFDTQGGTAIDKQAFEYGQKVTKPSDPTKPEFYFGGWYKEPDCTNVWNFSSDIPTNDIVLYAKWIAEPLEVTFNSTGGSAVESQYINEGEKAVEPSDPTKAGYRFEGWYKEEACTNRWDFANDVVTQDITLYANWIDAFTVDFNCNGGEPIESQYLLSGEKVQRPSDPEKADYYFAGWYIEPEFINSWDFYNDVVTGDMTLYADWTSINPYTVTFNSMGGSQIESQQVADRGMVSKPDDPAKNGYIFDGWYKEEACQNKWIFYSDIVRSDLTLYAKWLPAYEIVFDSNGGSEVEKQIIVVGEKAIEPDNPTKTDCLFAGWYAEQSYKNMWDFDVDIPTSNMTLYAKWIDTFAGSGTESNPYLIQTAEELWMLGRLINSDNADYMNKHYKQTADIDLSIYENWTPIGTDFGTSMTGSYDGGGHTISGMNIYTVRDESETSIGLFGYMKCELKNLNMTDSNIHVVDTGSTSTGSLIGMQIYGGISGCSSSANILVENGSDSGYVLTGGIVGYTREGGTVSDCSFTGTIDSEGHNSRCGGIVGALYKMSALEKCFNTGDIYGHGYSVDVGGIVGWSSANSENFNVIKECYNTGDINCFTTSSSTLSNSAGIVGCFHSTDLYNCFNLGNIDSAPVGFAYNNGAGGIIGIRMSNGGLIQNAYNTGTVTGKKIGAIGGDFRGTADEPIGCYYLEGCCNTVMGNGIGTATSVTLEELKQQATFAGFDFTDIWEVLEGEMSPVLQNVPYAYVTGVSIDDIALDIGDSGFVEPAFSPVNAANQHVSWESSNEGIATVTSDGEVTLLTDDTATITVTTQEGGFTDTCVVSKKIHVTSIEFDKTLIELMVGETDTITATLSPEDASDKAFTWASSNEDVALVSDGVISAVGGGTATITATTRDGGLTAQCTVNVTQLVSGVTLDETAIQLYEGDTCTLTETVLPSDATNKNVTWSSSNENIATVSDGIVTAVSKGNADITVTTVDGGYTAVCSITVVKHVTGVSLDKTSLNLKPGETDTLTATVEPDDAANKSVIWTTTDKSVATVFSGKVFAAGDGVAEIIVTTIDGGYSASCFVTVHQPVTGISLDKASLDLFADETHQLTAIIEPTDATNQKVIWTSSDTSVATVSNGLVTAKDWGTTTITVATDDGGFEATCEVKVSMRVLTSDVYFVDTAWGYIKDVPINTTPEEFLANFENNPENLSLSCGTEYIATGNTLVLIPDYSGALRVVVLGDTDSNAKISITDYTLTRLDILGLKSLKDEYKEAADINGDGKISITDYTLIRLDILGLKSIH